MTQKAPKAPRAKRTAPDRRRELILEEACRQCMQSDRPGISFVEIARKLGVARSLVYHYFPNQEALLFIRLAKSCFDRPLADKDDEVFYALLMFVRFLLARNCRQPREKRLKWVRVAVKTALAAAEATKESDLTEGNHE